MGGYDDRLRIATCKFVGILTFVGILSKKVDSMKRLAVKAVNENVT